MTRALRRGVLVAAATAVCLAALCAPALAGSYYVNACSPSTSSGLWAAVNTFPTSFTTGNNCGGPAGSEVGPLDDSNQGALYAEDILGSPTNMPDGTRAGWIVHRTAGHDDHRDPLLPQPLGVQRPRCLGRPRAGRRVRP